MIVPEFDTACLLRTLTADCTSFLVWKQLERGLTGAGDIDAAASAREVNRCTATIVDWSAEEGNCASVIVCSHFPGVRLHVLVAERLWPNVREVDVAWKLYRAGAVWTTGDQLARGAEESSIRTLSTPARDIATLVYSIVSASPPAAAPLDVVERVQANTDLYVETTDLLMPRFAAKALRGVLEALRGDRDPRHAAQWAWARLAAHAIHQPRELSARVSVRWRSRTAPICPIIELIFSHNRVAHFKSPDTLARAARSSGHIVHAIEQ